MIPLNLSPGESYRRLRILRDHVGEEESQWWCGGSAFYCFFSPPPPRFEASQPGGVDRRPAASLLHELTQARNATVRQWGRPGVR